MENGLYCVVQQSFCGKAQPIGVWAQRGLRALLIDSVAHSETLKQKTLTSIVTWAPRLVQPL